MRISDLYFNGDIILNDDSIDVIIHDENINIEKNPSLTKYDIEDDENTIYHNRIFTKKENNKYTFISEPLNDTRKSVKERINSLEQQNLELQQQNEVLLECLLEVSEIIYA